MQNKIIQTMKNACSSASIIFHFFMTSFFMKATLGDPRTQAVQLLCQQPPFHNPNLAVANFFVTMANISEQIRTTGFGVAVTGSGPDASYGLAQCYGDLSSVDCVRCYAEARTNIPACFPTRSGRLTLDGCFIRHETYNFFEEYAGSGDKVFCGNTTRKNLSFQDSARQAVQQAVVAAPSNEGYARAEARVPAAVNESAYVLANCWRTLNATSCRLCLEAASRLILGCFPWSEGRAVKSGCFLRYSDINFLNAEEGDGSTGGRNLGTKIVAVVAVVSFINVLVVGAAVGVCIWKHKKVQKKRKANVLTSKKVEKLARILKDSGLHFKYSVLEKATGAFDKANKLGQGGFGTVYKGHLADGREIAVKRLFFNHANRAADFYNEVNILSNMEHENLVRLLGCSCSGPESLLVYEFFPNSSLDKFIFDPSNSKTFNWDKRYQIIVGTAEGLVYLHEDATIKIIHRDIKASNILLDSRFHAKIADFGLARSFQEDESQISTAIAGTLGYMAPEYLAHGQLTKKTDVYCFGLLLLEIVTGRHNNMIQMSAYSSSLLHTVWQHFQQGALEELIDPNLLLHDRHNDNTRPELLRVLHIGLLCTQESSSLRPTMPNILRMLKKWDEDLPVPTNPPFIHNHIIKFSSTAHPLSSNATMS